MYDIIIVACRRDLPLLNLQAKSIDKFFNDSLVNRIFIILNDSDILNEVNQNLSYYGKFKNKIKLVSAKDLDYHDNLLTIGWKRQQLFKLLIGHLVETEYYITLDVKNIFLNHITQLDFFKNEKPICPKLYYSEDKTSNYNGHVNWVHCCNFFGIDSSLHYPHQITPFILKTSEVISLINYCQNRSGDSFQRFFYKMIQPDRMLTEYFLYIGFLYYQNKFIDMYHINETDNHDILGLHPVYVIRDQILANSHTNEHYKKLLVGNLMTEIEYDSLIAHYE